jgi:leucyl-tRNA synthetase
LARPSWPFRLTIHWQRLWPASSQGWRAFIDQCRLTGTSESAIETAEKLGFDTGLRVRHVLDPDRFLPVYVANFVLMGYGTGALYGCPAHDQRDLDFARKYGLPIVPVVLPPGQDAADFAIGEEAYGGEGTMINSRFLDGLANDVAWETVAGRLEASSARTASRKARARSTSGCATG